MKATFTKVANMVKLIITPKYKSMPKEDIMKISEMLKKHLEAEGDSIILLNYPLLIKELDEEKDYEVTIINNDG